MKRYVRIPALMGTGLLGLLGLCTVVSAAVLGDPGYYGAIEIGHGPIPQLVYPQPVWAMPTPYGTLPPAPLYLRVPPRIWHHWPNYCRQYQACGRPVYFVQDAWYQRVYLPYFHEHPEFWHREGGPFPGERHPEGRGAHEGEHRGEEERRHWREGDHERH